MTPSSPSARSQIRFQRSLRPQLRLCYGIRPNRSAAVCRMSERTPGAMRRPARSGRSCPGETAYQRSRRRRLCALGCSSIPPGWLRSNADAVTLALAARARVGATAAAAYKRRRPQVAPTLEAAATGNASAHRAGRGSCADKAGQERPRRQQAPASSVHGRQCRRRQGASQRPGWQPCTTSVLRLASGRASSVSRYLRRDHPTVSPTRSHSKATPANSQSMLSSAPHPLPSGTVEPVG